MLAEVGDGLVIRHEFSCKPAYFHLVMFFLLQMTAGTAAIEVSVDEQLKQYTGMIWRSISFLGRCVCEAKPYQIQSPDERVDEVSGVVFATKFS